MEDEFFNIYETAEGIEPKRPPPKTVPPYFPRGPQNSTMSASMRRRLKVGAGDGDDPTPVANWSIFFRAQRNKGGKYKKLYLNFHSLNPAEARSLAEGLAGAAAELLRQGNGGKKAKVEIDVSSILSSSP